MIFDENSMLKSTVKSVVTFTTREESNNVDKQVEM